MKKEITAKQAWEQLKWWQKVCLIIGEFYGAMFVLSFIIGVIVGLFEIV